MARSTLIVAFLLAICATTIKTDSTCMCGEYGGVSKCAEGFASLFHIDRAKGNTDLNTEDSQQVLIPDINFTCNGTITKWIFGAKWEGNSAAFTELQILRRTPIPDSIYTDRMYTKVGSTAITVGTENSSKVYEYLLSSPLAFQEGDILGYFQPTESKAEVNLYLENSERLTTYHTRPIIDAQTAVEYIYSLNPRSNSKYPVIAVRTDPPGCGCGFMSAERVYALLGIPELNTGYINEFDDQQLIFPDITFACSGVVVKWIVGGEWNGGRNNPEVQIWRPSGGSTYEKIHSTLVLVTNEENDQVYEVVVDPPLSFQHGDILGLFQPDRGTGLQVEYDSAGDSVYYYNSEMVEVFDTADDYVKIRTGIPLVTAEIEPAIRCTSTSQQESSTIFHSPTNFMINPSPTTYGATGTASPAVDSSQTFSVDGSSPSRKTIIIIVGVSGAAALLIAVALIVISVSVYLRKAKNKHVNATQFGSKVTRRSSRCSYTDALSTYNTVSALSNEASNTTHEVVYDQVNMKLNVAYGPVTTVSLTYGTEIETKINDAYIAACRRELNE